MTHKILTTSEVLEVLRVSHAHFYKAILPRSDFPKPFKLGARKNAWLESDVTAWVAGLAGKVH